jgi:ubiquinone/menaquinone biosynthesis C-methylase UbiE
MSKNGYFLINIDISDVVVHQMLEKSRLDYLLMDATRMNFKSQSFDLVIDKGTFDALAVLFK